MPHWDITCPNCGRTDDLSFVNHAAMREHVDAGCQWCDGPLEVGVTAPAAFAVKGFNAINHYGARDTDRTTQYPNGVKVTTKLASESNDGLL